MSLIVLQFALLWASRAIWGVVAFVLLLLLTALGIAGWLQTAEQILIVGWLSLLLHATAMFGVMALQNYSKYDYFLALKQAEAFQRAQCLVHVCSQVPLILVWGLTFGTMTQAWICSGCICLVMFLFCTVSAQAVFGNLLPRLRSCTVSRNLALLLVVAGPWILTAWILGMTSANLMMIQTASFFDIGLPVGGLLGLGIFQWWIGRTA